jgi:hypothetical protein
VLAPSGESIADLMGSVYVRAPFAKMIAVPDKLIETPHTYPAAGLEHGRFG